MNERNKRIITILSVFTIIFTVMGGSLAYWNWSSTTVTGVAFTIEKDFTCSADGGGNLNAGSIQLQPTSDCTNSDYALQRTIKVMPNVRRSGLTISLDMWLTVNSLGTNLSNSNNLRYALTTNANSCTDGVVSKGNFNGLTANGKVSLLGGKEYTATTTDTYYLYIWLDKEETNNNTQNESFNFSLGGECTDAPKPNAPILDNNAMIPVTIANDGTVTTVSSDDPNWYNYSNKEWANIVLVEDETQRNYYLNNLSNNVEVLEEDIVEYYVWIPRYKYKIPGNYVCGELTNPTPEEYPECYGGPYTLLIDKQTFYEKVHSVANMCGFGNPVSDCTQEKLALMDEALITGEVEGFFGVFTLSEILSPGEYVTTTIIEDKVIYGGPSTIDIVFEKKNDDMILGNAMSTYLSHPAFWNNLDNDNVVDENELLAGIWVGKFETTAVYKKDENDVSFSLGVAWPLVLPDIVGNNCFLEGDCHIIETIFRDTGVANMDRSYLKSSGWGAVAYLSHSEYGINEEIRTNNTQITGCGAKSDRILERPSDCSNDIAYGSGVSEYPQSTTGNISGIFDMAGGVWEYVEPSELEPIFEENNWPTMIDTLCNGEKCYGHALFETVNWYDDSFELRSLASESSEIKLYRGGGIDYPDKGLSNNSNDGIFSISAIMAESRGKNPRLTLIEIND